MTYAANDGVATRYELHFGDRLVRAFRERPCNFDALIRETAARHPDADAFVHGGKRLTHAEVDVLLTNVAGNLAASGVKLGARVGVLCDASIEFMLATFGAMRTGAISVPIGIRLQAPELEYVIEHCGMEAIVFDAAFAHLLPPLKRTPNLRRFVVGTAVNGATPFTQLLTSATLSAAHIGEEDLAMIMYTSGTTGKPKGAMLPHLALVHSALHFQLCMGHDVTTRALLAIPPAHISGLGAVVMPMLRAGGCTVISQGFKASAFLRQMAAERCTFTVLVPAMYKLCLLEPDFSSHDLSAWRAGIYGGAIMPPPTIALLMEKLPHLQVVNGYGATETASPAAVMPLGHTAAQPDSVGKTVLCGDIRILDDEGREVATGDSGELWIGGPMVAKGYWNDARATRESFVGGYWRSGDIGSIDAKGYVRILDRRKDMINRGGYKVYSAEIEGILARHPEIVESSVVPCPDPVLGERVFAFICASRADFTGDEVRAFCAPFVADYKLPERFRISCEPLPRNANGKFDKPKMRELAAAAATPHIDDAPVLRPLEQSVPLPWPAVRDYLARSKLHLEVVPPPRQFAGGLANLNYLVMLDGRKAVLRRPPFGTLPPGGYDMAREFRILSGLHRGFPLAPRGIHFCEDASVTGQPFQIIEFRRGFAIRGDAMPGGLGAAPEIGVTLSRMLMDTLAAIHAADTVVTGLDSLGKPADFLKRTTEAWIKRATLSAATPPAVVPELIAWLRNQPMPTGAATLIHNDFKLDNVLIDTATLRPMAVLDWDQCTRGDPLFDLATTLSYWTEAADPPVMHAIKQMPTAHPGFFTRQQAAEYYARATGRDLADFRFFRVLAIFKLAVIYYQLNSRYRDGFSDDPRYAELGKLADNVMEFAHLIARGELF